MSHGAAARRTCVVQLFPTRHPLVSKHDCRMSLPSSQQRGIDCHCPPAPVFVHPGAPAPGEDGERGAQVAAVPDAVRTAHFVLPRRSALPARDRGSAAGRQFTGGVRRGRARRPQALGAAGAQFRREAGVRNVPDPRPGEAAPSGAKIRAASIPPRENGLTSYGVSAIFLKCLVPPSNPFHGSVRVTRTSGNFRIPCRTRWGTRCIRRRSA